MATITIPRKVTKGEELIIVPRKEYEEFLRLRKVPLLKLTPAQKRDLAEGRRELARGEYITLEQLEHELGITRRKTR